MIAPETFCAETYIAHKGVEKQGLLCKAACDQQVERYLSPHGLCQLAADLRWHKWCLLSIAPSGLAQ